MIGARGWRSSSAASALALAMALAACNSSPEIDEKNASVGEVAAKVREASGSGTFVRPGEWQSKVVIEEFDIPGMQPEMVKNMKSAVAQNQQHSFTTCLSDEDANQPEGKFFTGNESCRYEHFRMGDGKIDGAMRCPAGNGMTQRMTMVGNYGPEHYDMKIQMTGQGVEGPVAKMTMTMRVESTRVGACKPDKVTQAG